MSTPVAVVAFDRISPFHLSVPCAVFGESHAAVSQFRLTVCSAEPGPLKTTAGFEVTVAHGLGSLAAADIIIVPSWRDPQERPPESLLRALVAAHRRGGERQLSWRRSR